MAWGNSVVATGTDLSGTVALIDEIGRQQDEIASLKSQLAEAQKDREILLGYLREIAVYGNKHMPAPEYAQRALAAMEAEKND